MIMILMIQMQESLRTQRSDSQPAAPTAPMTTVFTDAGGYQRCFDDADAMVLYLCFFESQSANI